MPVHGNSRKNNKDHHLYAIFDEEENDIFKYGISDKPIDEEYIGNYEEEKGYRPRGNP